MPVTFAIEGITPQGEGIGHDHGLVVFVPYTLPQDIVTAEIVQKKSRYARGKLIGIDEPAPQRTEPQCPYYYNCGGCAYQHTSYENQLQLKTAAVEETLKRIGGLDISAGPAWGMETPWHYRNKVTWQVGYDNSSEKTQPALGYYRKYSHHFIPINNCPLLVPELNEISGKFASILAGQSRLPASVMIRKSFSRPDTLLAVSAANATPYKQFAESVVELRKEHDHIIKGKGYSEEKLAGVHFRLAPRAFFQINYQQTERIIEYLLSVLSFNPQARILDGFCGVGALALPLARQASSVVGIDSYPPAIAAATANATNNRLDNCFFYNGKCEDIFPGLDQNFDLILLDPPRAGCHRRLLAAIIDSGSKNIVYISCNPAALARDLRILSDDGYQILQVQPLDMFPWTQHVETIVLLRR